MWDDDRCSHGVRFVVPCQQCLQVALGEPQREARHSCHRTYEITGQQCPMPTRQSEGGCGGCWLFAEVGR